jgi:actin beta/gamma 1
MKKKLCYVALDFDEENLKSDAVISCTIEGQRMVLVTPERLKCPELLFRRWPPPSDCALRLKDPKNLFPNVVLAGGISMFRGLPEGREKEIGELVPMTIMVKIAAPPSRDLIHWAEGSVCPAFQHMDSQN